VLSDRFGRKWPLVLNLLIISVLNLGTGFVTSFPAFLGVRSIFGIGMGGIWGLAASTALENLPFEVRGLASGVLQQGYAVGYLLAACVNLKLVPAVSPGWRVLFFTSAGISAFAAVVRACLPESEVFVRAKAAERARGYSTTNKSKVFLHETWVMLKTHWLLVIYAVLLMTGFNFLSHGSQDLYPTYLQTSKGFTPFNATVATIIGNCGAIVGGMFAGFLSQYLGRRLTIVLFCLIVGAFVPLWILPSGFGALSAGAFFLQVGVQGAWGVIPIQLAEISPPAFRATFPGVAYQLGNVRALLAWRTCLNLTNASTFTDGVLRLCADRGARRREHQDDDHQERPADRRRRLRDGAGHPHRLRRRVRDLHDRHRAREPRLAL
jgi:SHS family lactate transporter-like MFS transporter